MPSFFSSSQSNRNEADIKEIDRKIDDLADEVAQLKLKQSVMEIVSSTQKEEISRLGRELQEKEKEERKRERIGPSPVAQPVTINIDIEPVRIEPVFTAKYSPPPTCNHVWSQPQLIARVQEASSKAKLCAISTELGNKTKDTPFHGANAFINTTGVTLDEAKAYMKDRIKNVYG